MKRSNVKVVSVLFAALLLAACNRDAAEEPNAANAPPVAAPAPAAAPAIAPSTELTVRTVESVVVTRPQDAPNSVIIQVSGTVPSSGWTDAKLVPVAGSDNSIRSFNFVATSPAEASPTGGTEAIEAQLQIEEMPADVGSIRVVAATNEVSAFISPP